MSLGLNPCFDYFQYTYLLFVCVCLCACACVHAFCSLLLGNPNFKDPYLLDPDLLRDILWLTVDRCDMEFLKYLVSNHSVDVNGEYL